ncbi:hypothetical protein EV421DRAFT_2036642 [Armillaria borealis]|uniref:Protein kinase domain-containing protein n=1 Tax=Armillaria borealis TaxID=47425 RepID=A0AA39JE65_9AGAR|nr:hypothetical protein EV421DRAFT_2036642 [Armillaria borealis]
MDEHRNSILDDVRNVPSVSLELFQETILSRVVSSSTQIDEIATRLQANGSLQRDGRWTLFPIDPCMEPNENRCFKSLETIAIVVVEEAKTLLKRNPTAIMQTRPTQAALSEGRNGQFISDGHYVLCESKGARLVNDELSPPSGNLCPYERKTALACDRAGIEEYKLKDTWEDENDVGDALLTVQWLAKADDYDFQNNKKILGNAAQMMHADPCRRFMFGMTIANTTARLWYFSRARVLVSEPFNFISYYRHLIHYIVSMSFGSTEDLGYDSSITRVAIPLTGGPAGSRIQYDYAIDGETYRTVECLSSFRASGIMSRATRVWTVRKLGDWKKRECALKDFWIPLDSKTESEIQQDIFKRIEEKDPDAKKNPTLYKQYFMDIKACEVVIRTDKTADAIAPLLNPCRLYDVKRRLSSSAASRRSTSIFSNTADPVGGHLSGRTQHHHSQRVYTGRKHVRVLFSEVGTPLDKVQDQKMLFTGLFHAYQGLKYLHLASYVHRDMSSGNILLCSGSRGKISDLEYAKVFQSECPQSDPKTGTPIFMAVEVQRKRYLFRQVQEPDDTTMALKFDSIGLSNPFSAQQTVPVPHPAVFLHNFYHDAESLWWIGVHSLFTTEPSTVERGQDAQQIQRGHFNSLFPHHAMGSDARSDFLQDPNKYTKITQCLPDEFRDVTLALDVIRDALVAAYISAEAQTHFPRYDHFAKLFEKTSWFEKALDKAVAVAVNDIQPFQLEDRPMHEGAEDKVERALDRLKEENYTDDDAPENDADNSGKYIPPEGAATKKSIDEVDKDESSNEEPPSKRRRQDA